jgi:hypothetical protein
VSCATLNDDQEEDDKWKFEGKWHQRGFFVVKEQEALLVTATRRLKIGLNRSIRINTRNNYLRLK